LPTGEYFTSNDANNDRSEEEIEIMQELLCPSITTVNVKNNYEPAEWETKARKEGLMYYT